MSAQAETSRDGLTLYSSRGISRLAPNDMQYFGPPPPGWDKEEFLRTAAQQQSAASIRPKNNSWIVGLVIIIGFLGFCIQGAIQEQKENEAMKLEWTPTTHTVRTIQLDENGNTLDVKDRGINGMTNSDGLFVPSPL